MCRYLCVYMCRYVCVCMCMYVHVSLRMCSYVWVCKCVCMCVHKCVHVYVCVCVCMCIYMYVCVYTCMYVYVVCVMAGSLPLDWQHLGYEFKPSTDRKTFLPFNIFPHQSTQLMLTTSSWWALQNWYIVRLKSTNREEIVIHVYMYICVCMCMYT